MAITDRRTGSVVDIAFGTSAVTVSAPTVAQITGLTRIEGYIVGDGIDTPRDGTTADISALADRETFNVAATIENGDIELTMWREFDGTDAAWALFDDTTTPPTAGTLVVCRGGFTGGTPTAGDTVDVYTVEVVSRSADAPNKQEGQRFRVKLAVQDTNFDSTVAA